VTIAEPGPLQVDVTGLMPSELDECPCHLKGYEHFKARAYGNRGYQQLQLDIYGEMMDSVYLANKYGDSNLARRWQEISPDTRVAGKNFSGPTRHIGDSWRPHVNPALAS